jgi:transketolase
VGGSADLTGSNGVAIGARPVTRASFAGATAVHWGVREHAMGAAANGIALHGGLRPYVATFLMFHDYHRPAVRLSALMGVPVVWVYSHDSFHLGEDGPTHQPIESLVALRSIPRMEVWRPADGYEVAAAWRSALRRGNGPTSILLTRQDVPTLGPCGDLPHGARIAGDGHDVVVVATGSEVGAALDARSRLAGTLSVRVVSMPCRERFLAAPVEVRNALVPPNLPRVAFEAARMTGWEAVVGSDGLLVGIEDFGASAPAAVLARQYGLDGQGLAERLLARVISGPTPVVSPTTGR